MVQDTPSIPPREAAPPAWSMPAGACDSHSHVCGPADRFPEAPGAAYPLPHAPVEAYLAMLDRIGAARGVIVQPTPYGFDNSATLDALDRSGGRLRGIALAGTETDDEMLGDMARRGVRGLRFSYFPPGVKDIGGVGLAAIAPLAGRMRNHGLHAQLWAPCHTIVELLPDLMRLDLPIVLDHMARVTPADGVDAPAFRELLAMMRDHDIWVKLMPSRISTMHFHYFDLLPFHQALLEVAPDRLLWGTDWPFVRMGEGTPDAGALVDVFHEWTADEGLRRAILVDNPARLYGFTPESAGQT